MGISPGLLLPSQARSGLCVQGPGPSLCYHFLRAGVRTDPLALYHGGLGNLEGT